MGTTQTARQFLEEMIGKRIKVDVSADEKKAATANEMAVRATDARMKMVEAAVRAGLPPKKIQELLGDTLYGRNADTIVIDSAPKTAINPYGGAVSLDIMTHTEAAELRGELRAAKEENATLRRALADLPGKIDEATKAMAGDGRVSFRPATLTTLPLPVVGEMPDAWRYRFDAADYVGKPLNTAHDEWCYLLENGEFRIRLSEPDVVGNPTVRAVWRQQLSLGLRASIQLDALALGAKNLTVGLDIASWLGLATFTVAPGLSICTTVNGAGAIVGYGDTQAAAMVDYWKQTTEFRQHDERI